MTAAELNPELRKLIDARLAAIDHTLSRAQMDWSERRSIVGEVETQIFELLARRSESPAQDDVLAVLASLDPPDSYLPEELRGRPIDEPAQDASARQWRRLPEQAVRFVVRFVPGAAGVAALVIVNGVVIGIVAASEGVIPWLVTLGGMAWLNYLAVRRFRSWHATRHGNLFHDLRRSLGAWLLSKNGAGNLSLRTPHKAM